MARRIPPLKILITAGPTREYIDTIRYVSNDSSGKMGFEITRAALARGHDVSLVHGPVTLTAPPGATTTPVVSAAQMLTACRRLWPACDVLIMAAAVADYTPVRRLPSKQKKSAATLVLRLRPTTDILATLSRSRRRGQVVIGFALEDRRERSNAEGKLRRKRLDAIVLNRPAAIGADRSRVEVLTPTDGWMKWPAAAKARTSARILALAERLVAERLPLSHR